MKDSLGGSEGKSSRKATGDDPSYRKSFMVNLGSMAGGIVSGLVTAIVTAATTYAGFKAAGPIGAAGGMAIGSTSAEGAKTLATSWFDFRKDKKEAADTGSGGGSGIGGSISILQVKQLAVSIASKVTEGDSKLVAAIGKIDEAANLAALATDGSISDKACAIHRSIAQVVAAAEETRTLAVSAKGQISMWMGKI